MRKRYTLQAVGNPNDRTEITASSSIEAMEIAATLTGVPEWRVQDVADLDPFNDAHWVTGYGC
jgi:hypothetical protein